MAGCAVVLGGADCVWRDLGALRALTEPDIVIAVNAIGATYDGHIDHWATLHPENLVLWERRRAERGGNTDYTTWSHRDEHLVDRMADHWKGSSGLYGARVARELGYRAVLCGIPLDERPHAHTSDRWGDGPWLAAGVHRAELVAHLDEYAGWCRSMSGYTAELLGEPDGAWLRSS